MPAHCLGPSQGRTGQSIRMTACFPITALHDGYSIAIFIFYTYVSHLDHTIKMDIC